MRISVQELSIVDPQNPALGYALIAQAGFSGVDWNLDRAITSTDIRRGNYRGSIFEKALPEIIAHYQPELDAMKANGLVPVQAHAPFPPHLDSDPEVLTYMIEVYKNCIRLCDYAGCKNLIIHGISLNPGNKKDSMQDIEELNMRLYGSLIPTLLECEVIVCLENLPVTTNNIITEGICADAHEAVDYIDKLNQMAGREAFGFCLDTGHLQLLHKDARTFILTLGKRIKALHLHDNDGNRDCHLAPMTGIVNWRHICESLRAIGYDGDLSFETYQQAMKVRAFDEELLLPWLQLICRTGECFCRHIQIKATAE